MARGKSQFLSLGKGQGESFLSDINVNVAVFEVYPVGGHFDTREVIKELACADVIVPRMPWALHDFSVELARRYRFVLMAAESLQRIVLAVSVKKRDPSPVDVYLLARVIPDLSLSGNLYKCQSRWTIPSGYKMDSERAWLHHT